MANPLNKYLSRMAPSQLQESNGQGGQLDPRVVESFGRMAQMLGGANDQQQAIMNLAKSNPLAGQVMSMCSGGNFKDVFFAECRRRGLDPDAIARQLHIG